MNPDICLDCEIYRTQFDDLMANLQKKKGECIIHLRCEHGKMPVIVEDIAGDPFVLFPQLVRFPLEP